LQNLRGAEVSRAARYSNARVGKTVEASTDREGKQANTSLEKEEMLRREGFPPNDDDQYYELPPVGRAHMRVTEQTVKTSVVFSIGQKCTGDGQAVVLRHTTALEVGHSEHCKADEGGHSHGETSSGMEVG